MIDFLTIILLIFGVLQIILFFKVWGMTNNVKKIKKRLLDESSFDDVRKALLGDDKELAQKLLINNLISELIEYSNNRDYKGYSNVEAIIDIYKISFSKLGLDIPDNIKKIKTIEEIKELI